MQAARFRLTPDLQTLDSLQRTPLGGNARGLLAARAMQLSWLEAKSLALLQASLDAIAVVDADGKILEFNAAAEALFGYRFQEIATRPWEGTLLPLGSAFRKLQKRRGETTALRADGDEFPVDLSVHPVDHVRMPAYVCVFRDQTAARRAESLRRMQHRIIQLLAEAQDIAVAMPGVLETLCAAFEATLGNLWLLDGGVRLVLANTWGAAAGEWPQSVAKGEDLPGRVWETGEQLWVRNPASFKNLPRREQLRTAGMRGAGAFPISTRHSIREQSSRWRILLAEDSAVNRTLAIRLLEKRGHTILTAANGKEAVAAFQSQRFDLILMDVQMPEMDGHEATAAIRALETGGHRIPIIALTANALAGDRELCLRHGMDGYATKPIRADDLYREMDAVMRR